MILTPIGLLLLGQLYQKNQLMKHPSATSFPPGPKMARRCPKIAIIQHPKPMLSILLLLLLLLLLLPFLLLLLFWAYLGPSWVQLAAILSQLKAIRNQRTNCSMISGTFLTPKLLYILCLHSIKKNQIYPPHKENLA